MFNIFALGITIIRKLEKKIQENVTVDSEDLSPW